MSRPLPRWYRHRCPHNERTEYRAFTHAVKVTCDACGARFSAEEEDQPRGYITDDDIAEAAGFMRPEAVEEPDNAGVVRRLQHVGRPPFRNV